MIEVKIGIIPYEMDTELNLMGKRHFLTRLKSFGVNGDLLEMTTD